MVYACFVAKMSKMAFTRFGGQFQFEKSNGGQVRQFWGRALLMYDVRVPYEFCCCRVFSSGAVVGAEVREQSMS